MSLLVPPFHTFEPPPLIRGAALLFFFCSEYSIRGADLEGGISYFFCPKGQKKRQKKTFPLGLNKSAPAPAIWAK